MGMTVPYSQGHCELLFNKCVAVSRWVRSAVNMDNLNAEKSRDPIHDFWKNYGKNCPYVSILLTSSWGRSSFRGADPSFHSMWGQLLTPELLAPFSLGSKNSSTFKWKRMSVPCLSAWRLLASPRTGNRSSLYPALGRLRSRLQEEHGKTYRGMRRIIWRFSAVKEDHTHGPMWIAPWTLFKNMEVACSAAMRRPGLINCRPQTGRQTRRRNAVHFCGRNFPLLWAPNKTVWVESTTWRPGRWFHLFFHHFELSRKTPRCVLTQACFFFPSPHFEMAVFRG